MAEGGSAGDVVIEVVAVVGAIRQIERLRDQLQIDAFAQSDVLCQPQVEFEERIAAERVVFGNGASLLDTVQSVEAVLRRSIRSRAAITKVYGGKSQPVRGIAGRNHDCDSRSIAGIQGIRRV